MSGAQRVAADVTRSGDVGPPFTPGPVVNLTGQQIFIGNTSGGIGGIGTVSVTAGGILTAAQLVPGTGGLGTGFVNVTGAGSTVNLTGGAPFNGLDVGSWGTGVVTVSNGGLIACATVAACAFNTIGNAAGSTGTLTINAGSVTGLGQLVVGSGALAAGFGTPGANTSGTLSISNGGTLTTSGASNIAGNSSLTGAVTGNASISGAGSSWTISRDLAGGGTQAGLTVGRNANSTGVLTISNGASLNIVGSRSTPATDNSLPNLQIGVNGNATGTVTVTSGGAVRISGDTGFLNVGGNSVSTGGNGTLNITAGGTIAGIGPNGLTFVGVGRLGGASGTINISGAGSELRVAGVGGQNTQGLDGVGGLVLIGGTGGLSGALNVTNGGLLSISDNGFVTTNGGPGLRLADGTNSATALISGAGTSVVIASTSGSTATTPFVLVGNGGNAQMTISNGAVVSVLGSGQRNFTVSNTATGSGTLTMTNGATIVASRFAIADNGGIGTATIDNSTVNLDGVVYFNGDPIGAAVRVGRGVGAVGLLTMQNGAVINVNNTIDSASVILGGTQSLAGGTGTLNMSGGSAINFTGPAASASLQVGGTSGIGFMSMTGGSTVNVGATGAANVASSSGSSGTLTVAGGSSITANTFAIGGTSDSTAGGTGTATVTGAGSTLLATGTLGLFTVGRNGTGSLTVENGGSLQGTSFSLGRAAGGTGTLVVDNASLVLSGQQTAASNNSGANLSIGVGGGFGVATVSNGSVVSISNPGSLGASLNVGGRVDPPAGGGTGILNVSGSQVNLLAAPGQATVRIGHDGNGIATFTNSTLNIGNPTASGADGSLIVAGQASATGTLAMNAGSVVNAGYVGVGATTAGPGGAATMSLNDSTVNTTTFEIGAGGLLNGNNGVINALGDVIVAGTISPGNSPGRITINCNLIMLPGSLLILDIIADGSGYSYDQLRIGNDSTFDLNQLKVVFNFLDDTDPIAFAEAGGLDMDNFIQSLNQQTGEVTGLSTEFAPGQTWADILQADNITAASSAYDVTELTLAPDGTFNVMAVPINPVPEPSTWLMLALGLFALAGTARRRALAHSR